MGVAAGLLLLFSADPDPPVEIHFVMWKPHQPEAWERLLAGFHVAHPDIRVRVEIGPHSATDLHTLLVTKLRNQDASIDCFLIDVVWPTEFAQSGYLEPLDDLAPPEERTRFYPGAVDACTVDGRLMAVPFNIDAGVLFYRTDLVEKPPGSWEELIALAQRAVQDDPTLVGYTAQFDRYEGLVCNLLELGRGDPENPAAVATARRLLETVMPRACLNQREPQSRAVFLQGEAVFHRSWPSTWQIAQDPAQSKIVGRVGIAPLPGGVSCLGGWQLGVAAHSARKEAAKVFVRWLSSDESQKKLTLWTSQTHSRKALLDDPDILRAFPHFADLKSVLEGAVSRPKLPNYHEYSDRLQADLYSEISGSRRGASWLPAGIGVVLLALLCFLTARRGA